MGVSTTISSSTATIMITWARRRSRSGGIFSMIQKRNRPPATMTVWRSACDHTDADEANDDAIEELSTMTTPRPARTKTIVRIRV